MNVANSLLTIDLFLAGSSLVYFVEYKESFAWNSIVDAAIGVLFIITLLIVPFFMWSWTISDKTKKEQYYLKLARTLVGSLILYLPTLFVSYVVVLWFVKAFIPFGLWGAAVGVLISILFLMILTDKTKFYVWVSSIMNNSKLQ